jgi:two-component system chemotaxis response regulator CheB
LHKLSQLNPDLITLDVEMPEMDGLETLAALRKTYPRLPVIMFSTLTQRGATATLDALALGASDYVTKPANVGSVAAGMQRIRDDLIPKIKTFCRGILGVEQPVALARSPQLAASTPQSAFRTPRLATPHLVQQRIDLVAIGVSTGGPNALAEIFPGWAATFPVPIVVVQHMPPMFTKLLAERLAARSTMRITEGVPGDLLEPGHAWIAPGDFHMEVERHAAAAVRLQMHQGPPENSCRPAVDVLFRSVAAVYGPHALAVVLTGMGQDGLRGCEAIKEAGGQVFVQDEPSSVVWGMPGIVARSGLADQVLPLNRLAAEILQRVQVGRPAPAVNGLTMAKSNGWQVNRADQQR